MDSDFLKLVSEAKPLNSKIFSLPRLLILLSLENLDEDGAQYRELKAGLDMEDGVLYSNLNVLKKMGYIKENKIKVENKKMSSFTITEEGKNALAAMKKWLKTVGGENNE